MEDDSVTGRSEIDDKPLDDNEVDEPHEVNENGDNQVEVPRSRYGR